MAEPIKRKMITLSDGRTVEDWTTDWLDETLSNIFLLYNEDTNDYMLSYDIVPSYKVLESFVVDSRRLDINNLYQCIHICKTQKHIVEMFIRRCQHFNYSCYPFYFGIDKYLKQKVMDDSSLPTFDKLKYWKHIDFPPRSFIDNHPHAKNRYTLKRVETMFSEWLKYRIILGSDSIDSIPQDVLHSLDHSLITTQTHALVECFDFAFHLCDEDVGSHALDTIFKLTCKYMNKNNLSTLDLNDLTPLQLFDQLFPEAREPDPPPALFIFRKLLN